MIRSAWVILAALFWTAVYGAIILYRSRFSRDRLDACCRNRPRQWCLRLLAAAHTKVVVEGAENLLEGRQIVVANHESWFDVLALAGHLPVDYRFVAKRELAAVPVFGPSWQACGHISIDRDDLDAAVASLEEAGHKIREENATIVIFPEGTRSAGGELREFKKGAFVLAIQARVPVVPVGITGSREILPKGSLRLRPGTIHIRIGEPIEVAGMSHDDRDGLLLSAEEAVRALRERGAGRNVSDGDEERVAVAGRGDAADPEGRI